MDRQERRERLDQLALQDQLEQQVLLAKQVVPGLKGLQEQERKVVLVQQVPQARLVQRVVLELQEQLVRLAQQVQAF